MIANHFASDPIHLLNVTVLHQLSKKRSDTMLSVTDEPVKSEKPEGVAAESSDS